MGKHRNIKYADMTAMPATRINGGDQVLVLLPTSSNKLLAQWPYQVLKKVGKVNYLVDMYDHRK